MIAKSIAKMTGPAKWCLIVFISLFLLPSLSVLAQEQNTANTLKRSEDTPPEKASIEDMAWLAGAWKGEGLGGVSEEIWSAPDGGAMMGVYRLIKNGETVFYEMVTLVEEENSLTLRLKHFDADLTAWEEKEETVDFPFVKQSEGRFYFEGLTFAPHGDSTMTIYVALGDGRGNVQESKFRFRRIGSVNDNQTISHLPTPEVELIDSLFKDFQGEVPGASVMIARGGSLLFCKGYGLANLETGQAADCDTSYRVGSVSKQFTAMAILKLVDQGAIDLSDSIVDLVPGFPESRRDITVLHLLTHQSGLPDYGPLTRGAADMSLSDADVVAFLQSTDEANFPAGTEYRYSNAAYALLAEIVAARSTQSFSDFMELIVFDPLGMTSTTLYADRVRSDIRAMGYTYTEAGFVLTDQSAASAIQGDGSIYTSARDFFQWHLALVNESIVSPKLHQMAYQAQEGTSGQYGLGWSIPESPPIDFVRHGGSTAGFLSFVARIPSADITVAIFTNRGWSNEAPMIDLAVRVEALLSIASKGALPMPPKDAF